MCTCLQKPTRAHGRPLALQAFLWLPIRATAWAPSTVIILENHLAPAMPSQPRIPLLHLCRAAGGKRLWPSEPTAESACLERGRLHLSREVRRSGWFWGRGTDMQAPRRNMEPEWKGGKLCQPKGKAQHQRRTTRGNEERPFAL